MGQKTDYNRTKTHRYGFWTHIRSTRSRWASDKNLQATWGKAMTQHWIGVASKEHVQRGVAGGFAQVCHGKAGPLKKMEEGDWIIYYSPTLRFGDKEPCQSFTAIGKIHSGDPYAFPMNPDFIPWRR